MGDTASQDTETDPARRSRGGRPTRAAAAERDERLIEIAAAMFMEFGFDATSMDGVAEAASIGKATLYARYEDKAALFAGVLRRRILQVYEPIEQEFAEPVNGAELSDVLRQIASRLLEKSLNAEAISLGRILSAQGAKFPDLARLAVKEGYGRQTRLVETLLARFSDDPRYDLRDLALTADLFLSLVIGRSSRLAIFGLRVDPAELERRTRAAIDLFMRGIRRP